AAQARGDVVAALGRTFVPLPLLLAERVFAEGHSEPLRGRVLAAQLQHACVLDHVDLWLQAAADRGSRRRSQRDPDAQQRRSKQPSQAPHTSWYGALTVPPSPDRLHSQSDARRALRPTLVLTPRPGVLGRRSIDRQRHPRLSRPAGNLAPSAASLLS